MASSFKIGNLLNCCSVDTTQFLGQFQITENITGLLINFQIQVNFGVFCLKHSIPIAPPIPLITFLAYNNSTTRNYVLKA